METLCQIDTRYKYLMDRFDTVYEDQMRGLNPAVMWGRAAARLMEMKRGGMTVGMQEHYPDRLSLMVDELACMMAVHDREEFTEGRRAYVWCRSCDAFISESSEIRRVRSAISVMSESCRRMGGESLTLMYALACNIDKHVKGGLEKELSQLAVALRQEMDRRERAERDSPVGERFTDSEVNHSGIKGRARMALGVMDRMLGDEYKDRLPAGTSVDDMCAAFYSVLLCRRQWDGSLGRYMEMMKRLFPSVADANEERLKKYVQRNSTDHALWPEGTAVSKRRKRIAEEIERTMDTMIDHWRKTL